MKITAIICEYNPFHKGHLLQIEEIKRKNSKVVCIMSGGFVQRGQPALYDKYVRAKAAVMSGADLVLELPYPYSCSAAEFFCRAGVFVVDSLGVVDELNFGSECGSIDKLSYIGQRLNSDEFVSALKKQRENRSNREIPFAFLRSNLYYDLYKEELTRSPNDILGIEYVRALSERKSSVVPVTYRRLEGWSATESRHLITKKNDYCMIPEKVHDIFMASDTYRMENAEGAIISFYRNADPDALKKYEGMTNGIAERLVKGAEESASLNGIAERLVKGAEESASLGSFMQSVSGKTYTNAKIRRCILHGMTGVLPSMLKEDPKFTNVLAIGQEGRSIIKQIQKKGSICLLTKAAHYKKCEGEAKVQAEFNLYADKLLTLMCKNPKEASYFLKQTPYIQNTEGE